MNYLLQNELNCWHEDETSLSSRKKFERERLLNREIEAAALPC